MGRDRIKQGLRNVSDVIFAHKFKEHCGRYLTPFHLWGYLNTTVRALELNGAS
jgi:hypothetical protein